MKRVKLKIDLQMPAGWHELSQKQLDYLYSLLGLDSPFDRIKTFAFLKWAEMELLKCNESDCTLQWKGHTFKISITRFASAVKSLDWIRNIPESPCPLREVKGCNSIDPYFYGVPFSTFLMVDNYWQGYLKNPADVMPLEEIARLLYPGLEGKISPRVRVNCFYWIASLKNHLSRYFPNFLQSAPSGQQPEADPLDQRRRMDAQIRALTKGDITREDQVLASDTWRALAELDAIARDAEEFNKKLK